MNKIKPFLLGAVILLVFILATASAWIYSSIYNAMPQLDGNTALYGLNAKVEITRDEYGIATIQADSRLDAAMALGFVHGQERFFQMDLLRRNSAGELSSLFGEVALDYDKKIRVHRFRERARAIINKLSKNEFELIKAYTRGVNQGIQRLGANPFEYLLLRQTPVLWQEEDTILTVFSMYLDLQYAGGERELSLFAMQQSLPEDLFAFLTPKGTQWDAAIDGTQMPQATMPTSFPASISSKEFSSDLVVSDLNNSQTSNKEAQASLSFISTQLTEQNFVGSNNWAVSGALTKTGSAIVANDMHLGLRVPNTWYRASLEYKLPDGSPIKVTGATLPGTPNVIVGSNGHIAWGFTNSYGDWSDVVLLKTNKDKSQYLTPSGFEDFTQRNHMIAVKDQKTVEIQTQETVWGPVIGEDKNGNLLAYRWVAHDTNAVNLAHIKLETATNVEQAVKIAASAGIPAQNLMVADSQGDIAWTIMGQIPVKHGDIGELPKDWSTGEFGWKGYLAPEDYPKVISPAQRRLWTANSRVVGGQMYQHIGNGGYALGARAQQIKTRLFEQQAFDEQALLDIALDTEAIYLSRWQELLLDQILTEPALSANPHWQAALPFISQQPLMASVDSVGYRIVKAFKSKVKAQVFKQLESYLSEQDKNFSLKTVRNSLEEPLWQLVTEQPVGYLAQDMSWQTLLTESLDQALNEITEQQSLADATWGQHNAAEIKHPLSSAIPLFGGYLNMPAEPLPGDGFMPRVDGGSFGASERMIVSPGHEESGIFHMPTSQAGHPWSPYFGKGHSDWVAGKPSPFLPGETRYTLTLLPY
ncbi:penicillin acylase family protein [Thalassotalea euphylliae]|uniref:Penicillin acylase family protein n=1 Tax=Thalassotalea euphylliae TaxID=1655234 RepID=A0A3E0UCW0_9GAMM|nr:penicillin acylase family protein [Thalassotalea euphylliae]REL34736.1 penicillin acylase family protein [Thalassotalea euphylliae]